MSRTNAEELSAVLSGAPFVSIQGVVNARTLAGFPLTGGGTLRTGILFRSGEISHITSEGKAQLRALGIRRVFDLRTDYEIETYKTAVPEIDGVEVVRAPMGGKDGMNGWNSPESAVDILKGFQERERESFVQVANEALEADGTAISTVFRSIADHPDEGVLFHCTAGKDRTGLIAALILMLLGVADATIARDYALTTMGLEPARAVIMARLAKLPAFAGNPEGAVKMGSSKEENMEAILAMIHTEYGGAEAYLKTKAGLDDGVIENIKKNLVSA